MTRPKRQRGAARREADQPETQPLGDTAEGAREDAAVAPQAQDDSSGPLVERRQVTVPWTSEPPPTEFSLHLDVRLDLAQSTALRRVARALDLADAHLRNGVRVVQPTQAVRYLLERLAEA